MNDEPGPSLRDFVLAVGRRRLLFSVLFCLGMAATVAFWILAPRQYGSEGRINVRMGRTNLTLDPSANSSRAVTVMDAPETEIRSVMEIIKSRGLLLKVAGDIGPARILESEYSWLTDWAFALAGSLSGPGSPADGRSDSEISELRSLEMAAKEIGDNMKVYLEKNTSVISVYVKSASSTLSQEIVDAIMKRTQELHLQVHSASGSREFYQDEYAGQSRLLDEAIEAQRVFRNKHGFLSLDAARQTLQSIIDRVEIQSVDVEVELAEAETRAADLKSRLAGIREFVETPSGGNERLSTEGARARYFDLMNEKAKLLSSYGEEHWKVQELDRQMEGIKVELDRLPEERTVVASIVNPVYEKTSTDLISLESRVSGLKLRREALLKKKAETGEQLAQLNDRELESSLLQREIDINRSHLAIYSQKLGEAKVHDQLDHQALSAVVVSQPAVYMVKHVSPRGSIVLPAGALLSGFLATVACLASVRREDGRSRSQAAAEQILGAPVVASIPRVANRGQMVR